MILEKSRARDCRANGHGTYMLIDAETTAVVASSLPHGYGLDLDGVEAELTGKADR